MKMRQLRISTTSAKTYFVSAVADTPVAAMGSSARLPAAGFFSFLPVLTRSSSSHPKYEHFYKRQEKIRLSMKKTSNGGTKIGAAMGTK